MSKPISDTAQFITFSLANYLFGIPSQQIVKIVPTPTHTEGGLINIGLVQLAQYSIQILDLPKLIDLSHKLPSNKKPITTEGQPFLLVLQNTKKALFGVTLANPPDLLEIPTNHLQPVPDHQRQSGTLKWVSSVATHTTKTQRKIILLLDLPSLIS